MPGDFYNFSKESDEELMQMLDTVKQNRDDLTGGRGNWQKFEEDMKTELDRRGRTPDGGWKKPYEDANANKVDINKKLNQQIRSKEETRGIEGKSAENGDNTRAIEGGEKPNGTRPVDAQNPAPKNSAFEKAETVVTEPPPTTVTSIPEPSTNSAERSRSSATDQSQADGDAPNEGKQDVAEHAGNGSSNGTEEANQAEKAAANTSQPAPKTQAELAESARQKLEHGFQNNEPVAVSREEMKAFAAEQAAKREGSAVAEGEEGAAKPALPEGEGSAAQTLGAGGKVIKVGGEVMLGVGAFDMGKNVGQFINGEKSARDLAKDTMDMATGGVTGVIRERGGDYAKGSVAVEHEQQAKDQARSVEIGNKLQKYVPFEERKEIMAGIAKGDDTLLDKKLDELKAQGKEFQRIAADALKPSTSKSDSENLIPDREIAHVEADEKSDWQHVFGLPERTGQLIGGIYQGVKEDVKMLASIPVNAVQTTLGTEETNADEKAQKKKDAALGDRLIDLGADPAKVKDALDAQSTGDFEPMNDLVRQAVEKKKRLESQRVAKLTDDISKPQLTKSPPFRQSDESQPLEEPPPPKSTDDVSKPQLTKSPLFGQSEDSPPSEEPAKRELTKSPLFGSSDESSPPEGAKDFVISDGAKPPPEAGSLNDFPNQTGDQKSTAAAVATSGVALSGTAINFDTSTFARGQANEDAAALQPKVQGDYAKAQRIESALRAAEAELRQAEAEARRAAERRRQQEIADTRERQRRAYQRWLAQKRAYDQWAAQQRAAQERAAGDIWRGIEQLMQAPAQNGYQQPVQQAPSHQSGALVDPPH